VDAQSLLEQLLELLDTDAQQRFLAAHVSALDDQVASALKAQADQFLRVDIQRSLQIASLLYFMAELTRRTPHRALGLLAEANAVSIGLGDYQRGVELYDEAAQIYQAEGRLVEQARSQVGKIGSLRNLGRYEEAVTIGQWANAVLAAHGERRAQATLIMNMGTLYDRMGNLAQALDTINQAEGLYRQLGSEGEPGLGLVHMNQAVVLRNLGRFDESIQASQMARAMLTRWGQHVESARAQQSLALTYFVLGRYNEALDNFDQVRDVFMNDGRLRDAVLVELFTSDCLLQLRRFADVLEKCRRVRHLFTELGSQYVVAQAIVNEAIAYAELARYAEALASLAEARRLFEAEGNRVWVASADLEKAVVLLRQAQYEACLAVAQDCAHVFRQHDLPVEEAQACLVAARATLALGRYSHAERLAAEALTVGETRIVPTLLYQAHQLMGALAAAQGQLPAALVEYDRAIEELERLRGRLMVEFRVGFLEDKEGIYEDAVELCLNLDQPLRGLEYAERAKSRALLDLLAHRLDLSIQVRNATDRPLVDELARLRAERDRLCRRWESDTESGERGWTSSSSERQQAQQDVLALEQRITELWHRLLIRNADYARDAALWQVRTEPIQPYLQPGTLLLEYFAIRGQFVAFLITRETVRSVRLPGQLADAQRRMQRLWLNLKTMPHSTPDQVGYLERNVRDLLGQLYAALIEPLIDALSPYPQLVIVPHGPLHYLPFHALHDGQSYLVQRHEINYLPSSSFLRYCHEAQLAPAGLVAIGHSNAGRLLHAVQEARSIAGLMKGQVWLEQAATLAQLREAATEARVLHLAAHGDFRPDNPLFSGLALDDGWLTTLDIFNLRLRASLVTLSACQTGRSVVSGGDELLGLMRAFLSAGAASLVLSLWAVEDRSTEQLMKCFYTKMAEGYTKGAALRFAQLQFIEGQVEPRPDRQACTHPYFWAPFFLVGDAGPL